MRQNLRRLKPDYVEDQVDCDLFVRLVAIILEQSALQPDEAEPEAILDAVSEEKLRDEQEQEQWFNAERNAP